ncbi:hypothetical protein O181_003632 [Austropuccinia psidii MF-1]|uniref:Uncharacterized protein n=1 Tax=Austropuccinia psidii MF-1 TaxID=1389203 RepID=A0A9Q3GF27_9BASI|nr:hypothetical protein [Austropuccinia psidii MF-1]
MTLLKKNLYLFVFLVPADNPEEDNKTNFERLVEETRPSSPTPIVNKKKETNKLFFPGLTIQDSEEEDPSTPFNQMLVDSESEFIPQKGKEMETSQVKKNLPKEVPYLKGKSQICP